MKDKFELLNRLNGSDPLLIMAPLAELSHAGLRTLVDGFGGCDLFFTEMVDASSLVRGGPYEIFYRDPSPGRDRLIFQITGSDRDTLSRAAALLSKDGALGIDINMGCSAPLIIGKGAGCAWMRNQEAAAETVAIIRRILPENVSLSAKIRLGETEDRNRLLGFCRALENAGLDFLTLHPKTRKERHSRPPRWEHVSFLRENLNIPVIGNGHITTPELCGRRLKETGGGGIMIGREAVKRPWVFRLCRDYLNGKKSGLSVDLLDCLERFFILLKEKQPEDFHLGRAIKFSGYFHTNLIYGHRLHTGKVEHCKHEDEILSLYREYFKRNPEERITIA